MQEDTTQGKPGQGESMHDHTDLEKRLQVYGLGPSQLLDHSIVVSPGKHVLLSGLGGKSDERGLVRLQPRDLDDVKRWIGVPDHLGARHACRCEPIPAVPGAESASDFRRLDPEERRAVHAMANEYVHGDSRRVANYKSVLNHLVDRAVITGVFLREDIDIHRGAVLEVGKDVKVLFARHIRIYRGGLLKLTGGGKIDCVTITGNLLEHLVVTVDQIPAFARFM